MAWVVRQFDPTEQILALYRANRQSWWIFVIPTGLKMKNIEVKTFATQEEADSFLTEWLKTRPTFLGRVMIAQYDELIRINPLSPFPP